MSSNLKLFVAPGAAKYDVVSLDPESLIAASYLQLLRPGQWQLVAHDGGQSPDGALPYLQSGLDVYSSAAILPFLLRGTQDHPRVVEQPDAKAFHALLDTTVLPLALHSLYSLPKNWRTVRPLIASSLPYPTSFYRPEQLRNSAKDQVESTHPEWWGMGGEAEKEEEDERRRKRILLDTSVEAWKDRKDEERKEGKERMKNRFGEGKITTAARDVFTALETTLSQSSTPFFFSSSSPTPLDAHLSSLLTLVLFIPLPQSLLGDLINASFPRLWAHSNLLRRTLWSEISAPTTAPSPGFSWGALYNDLPSFSLFADGEGTRRGRPKKETKDERRLRQGRYAFGGLVVVGLVAWAVATGAVDVWGRAVDDDEEWEEEEEDEEDD